MRRALTIAVFLVFPICAVSQQQPFDGKSWWQHVEVLAADNMEGRGMGTAGLLRAEAYVIDQLKKAGLAPAGNDGYYQSIAFVTRQMDEKTSSAELIRDGKAEPLLMGDDAFFTTLVDAAPSVQAPLVFAGYGLNIPEMNYNDFSGLDLNGKIAVTIDGAPGGLEGPLATHYFDTARRWKTFRDAGAIGWILIPNPADRWPTVADQERPTTYLANDQTTDGERLDMWLNPAHADKLFEGTGHTTAELFELVKQRRPLPRFSLLTSIRATQHMLTKPLESANVIAKLEGSDPALKNEYVVLSAHIDHLGIGEPLNGDPIYHGAIDNASGVAALLDIIAALRKDHTNPKRSVLFAFFTAEEQGLLGSKYFVEHSTVQARSIVGNINVDGVHAFVPLKEIRVIGMDESSLGESAARAAASQNVPADSETTLNSNAFTCCGDHSSFVTAGIPAIAVKVGFPGELAPLLVKFRRERMHTPADNLQQPINIETAAKFEAVLLQVLLNAANDSQRPEWKPGSFYWRYVSTK